MFSQDRQLSYDVTQAILPPLFEEPVTDMATTDNELLLGATLRTATAFGRTATVKAGEDIRPAMNSLKSAGGGNLILLAGTHRDIDYDIVGAEKINILGEGRDKTILDFNGNAAGIKYIGTSGDILENFKIADLTVQNSNNAAGIDIDYADFWSMENVRATSCDQGGIRWQHTNTFRLNNILSDNNTGTGIQASGSVISGRGIGFSLIECKSNSNGSEGFSIGSDTGTYIECSADGNTQEGFAISGADNNMVVCRATNNGGIGIQSTGFNRHFGCLSEDNTGVDYDVLGTMIGCEYSSSDTAGPSTNQNTLLRIGNKFGNTQSEQLLYFMKNTSGSTITTGEVVVFKDVAAGDEIDTTTTAGDDKVLGVKTGSDLNNKYGEVIMHGMTFSLKVDGTTDIAIGDYLSAFTSAGIAQKASTGHTVFAIALEAYSTDDSNGVIDAYILPWRMQI